MQVMLQQQRIHYGKEKNAKKLQITSAEVFKINKQAAEVDLSQEDSK